MKIARLRVPPTLSLTTAAALANGGQASPPAPDAFRQGMVVLHSTFGLGQVVALSGKGAGRAATVDFQPPVGRKRSCLPTGAAAGGRNGRRAMSMDASEHNDATGWWARPCGGRDVLQLAVPLFVSMAAWTVMNFIDRMFLLWYSEESMAAVMPSGMVHFVLICFPLGVASYVNTFVAQYHGAGHPKRVGAVVSAGRSHRPVLRSLVSGHDSPGPVDISSCGTQGGNRGPGNALLPGLHLCAGADIMAAAFSAFFTGMGAIAS